MPVECNSTGSLASLVEGSNRLRPRSVPGHITPTWDTESSFVLSYAYGGTCEEWRTRYLCIWWAKGGEGIALAGFAPADLPLAREATYPVTALAC